MFWLLGKVQTATSILFLLQIGRAFANYSRAQRVIQRLLILKLIQRLLASIHAKRR